MLSKIKYDVVIVGAGPAGTACALRLKSSGLKIALIDKSRFPRDKICGDAIPGDTWKVLNELIPESAEELKSLPSYHQVNSTLVNYNTKALGDIFWINKAVNIKRIDFDNYLFNKVLDCETIDVFQETKIINYSKKDTFELTTNSNQILECKFLVAADGANSATVKAMSKVIHPNTKIVSIRAYYEGLDFDLKKNYTYSRTDLVGYFWIFPLGGNQFNVGIGYDSEMLPKGKSSQELIDDFISADSDLKRRFKNAKLLGNIKGHKLPLGGKKQAYAQDGFLPIGDAAFLVDPLDGHGIDTALASGKIAADVIIKAFKQNDFSKVFLQEYDELIHATIYPELRSRRYKKKILFWYPGLLKIIYPIALLVDKRFKKSKGY